SASVVASLAANAAAAVAKRCSIPCRSGIPARRFYALRVATIHPSLSQKLLTRSQTGSSFLFGGVLGLRPGQLLGVDDGLVDGAARRPEVGKFGVGAVALQHIDRRHRLVADQIGDGALDDRPMHPARTAFLLDIVEPAVDHRIELIELALRPPRLVAAAPASATRTAVASAPGFAPGTARPRLAGLPAALVRRPGTRACIARSARTGSALAALPRHPLGRGCFRRGRRGGRGAVAATGVASAPSAGAAAPSLAGGAVSSAAVGEAAAAAGERIGRRRRRRQLRRRRVGRRGSPPAGGS